MGRFGNLRERTIDDDEVLRGWVPPGYDYMGPGNDVHIGAARNAADQVSKEHDIEYGHEEEVGVDPKWNWVDADDEFLRQLQPEGFMERGAQFIFSAKKAAKSVGLVIGDMSGTKRKSKAIRASPWEEGEDFRTARLNRQRNRNTWLNTRGHHTTGIRQSIANEQDWANMPELVDDEEEEDDDAMDVEEEDNWNANDAMTGWAEHVAENGGRNPINSGAGPITDIGLGGRRSLPNLPSSAEPMDTSGPSAGRDDPMGEPVLARSGGGGGGPSSVSKETPISNYPSLTYGLQETHTTILPYVAWMSVNLDRAQSNGVQLKLRLNSIYDMLDIAINAAPGADTAFTGSGFSNKKIGYNGKTPYNGSAFPHTLAAGTNAAERPQWRDYWAQVYQYYTVLGCEYEIVHVNPVGNWDDIHATPGNRVFGGDIIVGEQIDTYSDTAAATGNVMPLTNLPEVMNYKNIKWHRLEANGNGANQGNTLIVKGRYMPGQAKRNIVNDGDVKTWTAVGSSPNLKEFLTLNYWMHPLSSGTHYGANLQVRLKYIVQFKDLVAQARYPNSFATTGNVQQTIRNSTTAADQVLTDGARQSST